MFTGPENSLTRHCVPAAEDFLKFFAPRAADCAESTNGIKLARIFPIPASRGNAAQAETSKRSALHEPMRHVFQFPSACLYRRFAACLLSAALCASAICLAQGKPAPNNAPDVIVLSNGDTLHGKFVNAIAGKVTFHSDSAGDITLPWSNIRELHTSGRFAVLSKNSGLRTRKQQGAIPAGSLVMKNQSVTVYPSQALQPLAPIPVDKAQYVVPADMLEKEATRKPSLLAGWGGAATAGATLVTATQSQYTFSGGVSLARVVPSVTWLARRNRTAIDFTGSFGKITQPSYLDPATGTVIPAVVTKTAIYHADAERDENFSPRFFALAQTAFDHNFSQNLDLQQIYGGGFGWTAIKTPNQEADLKATVQYEKQLFLSSSSTANQNLVGSTFSADYSLQRKRFNYAQILSFIPAYNNPRAYSASETNTLAFPAYKNLSFSVGTEDSYLNDPPTSLPPTKRNSFQFTMGLTFAIKPKY